MEVLSGAGRLGISSTSGQTEKLRTWDMAPGKTRFQFNMLQTESTHRWEGLRSGCSQSSGCHSGVNTIKIVQLTWFLV
jgi:hypothetical protein